MNMIQHTPGPWRSRKDERQSRDFELCLLGIDGPNNEDIIRVEDTYGGYPECGEELRIFIEPANFNLIMAAPELLAAIKGMVEISQIGISEADSFCAPFFAAARAAIARAEGTR